MRRLALLTAVVAAASVLAACGSPAADLMVVHRTGLGPGARLTLLIGDGGTVRCNGGPEKAITSADLIRARKIARELNGKDDAHPGPAVDNLTLPPRPQSILRYAIRSEKGQVSFSDNSPKQSSTMFLAQKLTRDMARRVCGLPR